MSAVVSARALYIHVLITYTLRVGVRTHERFVLLCSHGIVCDG